MKTPFVIVGIGKSGLAAKNLLLARGVAPGLVHTFDEKNTTADYKTWSDLDSLKIGTLVVSPGVPLATPGLVSLKNKGWSITSEINLACEHFTDEIIIGITGSVGKSTVTTLLGEALKNVDPHAFVGGNLGIPLAQYAIDLLSQKKKAKYLAVELSSYQLENAHALQLDYSIITFLSANHLERYPSVDAYYQTKCAIGQQTKNACVINESSKDLLDYKKYISCPVESINYQTSNEKVYLEKSQLIGEHNLDNLALALQIAKHLGLPEKAFQAMIDFKGLSHRLETVGIFNQILYINDSKATAMDSVLVATQAALTKTAEHRKLFLFLGGKDKNLPWDELNILKSFNNLEILFFGQCGELAQVKSALPGNYFAHLEEAINYALSAARPGDVVLLSPGGTSLDEFKNFEERGNFFKKIVGEYYSAK